jgi:transcriptional regulator GlxA family with amidase domain
MPAAALAHDTVDLVELLGRTGDELIDRLTAAEGWPARFAVLDDVLVRTVREHALRPELSRAWSLIDASDGAVPVAGVADHVGWSRRHLLNQFRAEFGLTPKVLAQVMRFDRANRRLRNPTTEDTIGLVAAECGYADQAHLNRDFVRFAGAPPSVWRSDPLLFPSVQDGDRDAGR